MGQEATRRASDCEAEEDRRARPSAPRPERHSRHAEGGKKRLSRRNPIDSVHEIESVGVAHDPNQTQQPGQGPCDLRPLAWQKASVKTGSRQGQKAGRRGGKLPAETDQRGKRSDVVHQRHGSQNRGGSQDFLDPRRGPRADQQSGRQANRRNDGDPSAAHGRARVAGPCVGTVEHAEPLSTGRTTHAPRRLMQNARAATSIGITGGFILLFGRGWLVLVKDGLPVNRRG